MRVETTTISGTTHPRKTSGRCLTRSRRATPAPITGVLTLTALAAALLAGCHTPAPAAGPTDTVLRVPDYDAFLEASSSTLRRCRFTPDRVDRGRGLIMSDPTTSGQWFELWRVDSQGGYQTLESSLHTMRRVVTVNLEPLGGAVVTDAGVDMPETQPTVADVISDDWDREPDVWNAGRFRLSVRVDKYRYSAPERQITTASGALSIYSQRVPTTEGRRGSQSRVVHWVPLGRDPLLEAYLLEQLVSALPGAAAAE